ncbi:hypothetical protein D3C71_1755470 [compost metagenome]
MFEQLSNDETKILEHSSTSYVNLGVSDVDIELVMRVQGWYRTHGLKNASNKDKVQKLQELIGFKQNYNVRYTNLNAVWGLKWNDVKFVLYRDESGLTIQVEPKLDKNMVKPLLEAIEKVIVNEEYKDGLFFK